MRTMLKVPKRRAQNLISSKNSETISNKVRFKTQYFDEETELYYNCNNLSYLWGYQ